MDFASIRLLAHSKDHLERCRAVKAIGALKVVDPQYLKLLLFMMVDETIAVRLCVVDAIACHLNTNNKILLPAIEKRMAHLEPDVFMNDPHFLDDISEAGKEYHAYAAILEKPNK